MDSSGYRHTSRQVSPTRVHEKDENPQLPVLTEDQVHSWQEQGFCLVDGILPASIVEKVQASCDSLGDKNKESGIGQQDNGFNGLLFPCLSEKHECLNEITLSPRIITACAQLLVCPAHELRLSQSELWAKFGARVEGSEGAAKITYTSQSQSPFDSSSSQNQRIHVDGYNHYVTFPSEWYNPEAVALIIYYDDTDVCGGGTCIVPRQGDTDTAYHQSGESPLLSTPGGRSDLPWINDKTTAEEYLSVHHPEVASFRQTLYEREVQVRAKPGTILFYRLDVWHRGVPLLPGASRRVQNMIFKHSKADWVNSWNAGAARNMYTKAQTLERIIATSTMHQRYCLGFPHEDSSYWTPYTLEATKARYSSLSSGCLHMEKIEDAVRRRQEQPIYRVFVYGSLLRGLENHFLIQNEKFVHRAHTVEEFYMVSNNNTPENNISAAYEPTLFVPQDIYKYPFLMRKPAASGHTCSRIVGEVYEVTAEALAQLDRLEDHPTSYLRQSIQVENMEKGGKSRVDAYILNSEALFTDISTSIAKNLTPCPFEVVKAEHAGSWMRYLGK